MSEFDNPYAPPQTDEEPPPSEGEFLVSASQGARFVNLVIDNIFIWVMLIVVMLLNDKSLSGSSPNLLYYAIMIGYYVFCETVFQATLGKLVTRTRVVALGGGKPSIGQVFGRTFSRFVPFEAFSYLKKFPTGWHDRWSNTRVVNKR